MPGISGESEPIKVNPHQGRAWLGTNFDTVSLKSQGESGWLFKFGIQSWGRSTEVLQVRCGRRLLSRFLVTAPFWLGRFRLYLE
jgi:hypothetical protein